MQNGCLMNDVKHPFRHFIQYGWCFIRAGLESLVGIVFLLTFASVTIIYKRYEEDNDFVVDGSSCHNN